MQLLRSVTRHLGEKTLIKDLNKGMMDGYATQRLKEDSPARKGERISPGNGKQGTYGDQRCAEQGSSSQ